MNPEEIIAAFLKVWETNPNDIFEKSGAINGLDRLNDIFVGSQSDSNEEFANKLGKWCEDYPELTQVVLAETERKLKPENNISTQEDSKTLTNRYPKISQTLRDRQPQDNQVKP